MNDTRAITLSGGHVAIIDADDEHIVSGFKWSALETGGLVYARRTIRISGKQKTVLMHRVLMNAEPGQFVDHIDGNGLNCRRSNMRIVTKAQNNINKRTKRTSATGVKGVRKHSLCNKYMAEIKPHGSKRIYLGLFDSIELAQDAYRNAAAIYHKEFRREK